MSTAYLEECISLLQPRVGDCLLWQAVVVVKWGLEPDGNGSVVAVAVLKC